MQEIRFVNIVMRNVKAHVQVPVQTIVLDVNMFVMVHIVFVNVRYQSIPMVVNVELVTRIVYSDVLDH